MKKKMKPATRRLVITLCVLVVLAAAAAALLLPDMMSQQPGGETSSASSAPQAGVEIIGKDITAVKSVTVTNETGTYHIQTKRDTDASVPTFYVEELSEITTSTSALQAVARHGYLLSATVDLGPKEELNALSEYGLDKPAVTIVASFTDGTPDFKLEIGNKASTGTYVMTDGHVYIASIDEAVYADMHAFIESSLYTIQTVGDGSDVVDYIRLSGTHFEQPISVSYTGNSANRDYNAFFMPYVVTEPYLSGVNVNRIDEFVKALSAPQAKGTAGYKPDADLLAELGLDEPYAVCEISINGSEHVLRAGDVYNKDFRYLMVDDNPVVFVAAKADVDVWAETTVLGMRDGFVWSPVVKKTNGLKVTADGRTWDYRVTRKEDTEVSSAANGAKQYVYTATLNGSDVDYEAFRKVFSSAIAATVLSVDEREIAEQPAITLEYSYYEGGSTVVDFYEVMDGERRYAAYVSGTFVGIVKASYMQDLLAALPR